MNGKSRREFLQASLVAAGLPAPVSRERADSSDQAVRSSRAFIALKSVSAEARIAPIAGSGEPVPQSKLTVASVRASFGVPKPAASKYSA